MNGARKMIAVLCVLALAVTAIFSVSVSAAEKKTVIAEYTFEDGTANDVSGNNNNGTANDGVTFSDGKAVFAEGNGGISLPDDIFANVDKVEIEFVITPAAFRNYTNLLGVGDSDGKWVVIGLMEDGSVRYAIATNGDNTSESKGNSTSTSEGNAHATFQSEDTLELNKEYTLTYVIEQDVTNVYIDGELALTLPTEGKDLMGNLGGPVVVGKATKWPDPSFEGSISSIKISSVTEDGSGNTDGDKDTDKDDGKEDNTVTGDFTNVAVLALVALVALGAAVILKKKEVRE